MSQANPHYQSFQIVYWSKQDNGWTPLPTDEREVQEPATFLTSEERIALYWSAHQESGSLWCAIFKVNPLQSDKKLERLIDSPYSQRTPLPISDNQLLFRFNQSLSYQSTVYKSTRTLDHRYAGCTTIDTHNLAKLNLINQFEDFQTYTVDAPASSLGLVTPFQYPNTIKINLFHGVKVK